ncbi:MAG: RtcB family protein [Nanoarchaeota archaeon]|nr:RtcB family protein [Nanoarchaeota archaeon]
MPKETTSKKNNHQEKESQSQINPNINKISKEKNMKVPGVVFASPQLFSKIKQDKTLEQIKNVATLPGIVEKSIAMPDAHQGYGFPVGGVAAFNLKTGVISPGGIGYDINCGVRLLASNITKEKFLEKRSQMLKELDSKVPSGVSKNSELRLTDKEISEVLLKGSRWALEKGFAVPEDLENTEDSGCIPGADPKKVSQKARGRGHAQLGTLGSGNHFLEVQVVEEIFNQETAKTFGLKKNQVVVLIHCGSRGLGHQTCSDYIKKMEDEFGFDHLADRELACAPLKSQVAKDYIGAMNAAANFAFCNRQIITHKTRESFKTFFPKSSLKVVYDIAHNIAKFEDLEIKGKTTKLCVHRKGATRSFGPRRKELPKDYQKTGQPIFIPGSMGTYSYVLVGTKEAEKISFASTAHGAGRVMSRTKAKQTLSIEKVKANLKSHGVIFKAGSDQGLLEEAPESYKDVSEVVRVSDELGIGKLVAKLKPLAVVKG